MRDMSASEKISIVACAILVLTGISLGIYFGVRSNEENSTISNILFQFSFRAELDINTTEKELDGATTTRLELEWDNTISKLNFREIQTYTSPSGNLDLEMYAILNIVDDKATSSLSYDKNSYAFCVNDVTQEKWYRVFRNILVNSNTIKTINKESCAGTSWEMIVNEQSIELCISGSQLIYVIHQGKKALVAKWDTESKDRIIQLPANILDGPCNPFYNNITLSYEKFDQRKKKRDVSQTPKTCLFVHGAGESPSVAANGYHTRTSFPDYWGSVQEFTPDCTSHKFIHYDSVNNGWDNNSLHENFCEFAATSGIIKNKVIFSHSMGNLVIAAALHRNKCTFDKFSSRWFSVQGPWRGSKAADTLVSVCNNPSTVFENLLRIILKMLKYCQKSNKVYQAYETLRTGYSSPVGISHNDLIAISKTYVSGVMCGTNPYGMGGSFLYSLALSFIAYRSKLEKPNDGMVALTSCNLNRRFKKSSDSRNYAESFNHAEGRCTYGNPNLLKGHVCVNKDVNPCRWYFSMHA